MNILKKLLLLTICVLMITSTVPALGAEEISFKEDFNSYLTGSVPAGDFEAHKAGGADIGIVDVPDDKNKSVYLRGADAATASLKASFLNTSNSPLTISFRFMVPSGSNVDFPQVVDTFGGKSSIFSIENNTLKAGGSNLMEIQSRRWYYVEATFNISKGTYTVSVDDNVFEDKYKVDRENICEIIFGVDKNNENIYFDDISIQKTTVGGEGRVSFPSKMWTSDAQQLIVDEISLGSFTMFNGSIVAYKNGVKMMMPDMVREIDGILFVPLRFTAENIGAEVVWNETDNAVFMMFSGKTIKLLPGQNKAFEEDSEVALKYEMKNIGGTSYISCEDIGMLLGRTVNSADGYVMFGDEWDYYQNSEVAIKEELYRMVKYQRPSGDDMYNMLLNQHPDKHHPRLFTSDAEYERLKNIWVTDEFGKKALDALKTEADNYLSSPKREYKMPDTSGRMYSDAWCKYLVNTCALMYHLTGEEKYAQRAKEELMYFVQFPELGHVQVLDMGDVGQAIGYGYDWLYDYLTEAEKKTIRDNVIEKLFPPLLRCYEGDDTPFGDESYPGMNLSVRKTWVYSRYNFNPHINQGAIMCILAMIDDFDDDTRTNQAIPILNHAVRSLEFFFDEWYPDGGWQEGVDYGAAVLNNVTEIISFFKTAFGTDLGLTNVPGLSNAGFWALYMDGPVGSFNYGDASDKTHVNGSFGFWMSRELGVPIFAANRAKNLENVYFDGLTVTEMFSYYPEDIQEFNPPTELDRHVRNIGSVSMRSGWSDNDLYAAIHSGLNGINHSQLDTGSFILDWAGKRWVKDIGVDAKTANSYQGGHDMGYGYRERAEGHNTLVFDSSEYLSYEEGEWPVIMQDDFEDYSIETNPSRWRISEDSRISHGDPGIVNVEYQKMGDNDLNKAVRMEQTADDQSGFYMHRNFGEIERDYVKTAMELSFKFKLSNIDTKNPEGSKPFVNLYSPAVDGIPAATVYALNITQNGVLRAPKGSEYHTLLTLDPSKWYDIKVVINVQNQTMNVFVDGALLGPNLPLAKKIAGIAYVRFSASGTIDFECFVDDVIIKVDPSDKGLAVTAQRKYDQSLVSNSPITEYVSKPKGSYAITDMTGAYMDWVTKAKRGIMLTDNRNTFIVRDEVTLPTETDVYWFAHSLKADVSYEISPDGKSAILYAMNKGEKTGTRMWAGIISNVDAKFTTMEAKQLPGAPEPTNEGDNSIFHKLAIVFKKVKGDLNFSVAFIPLEEGQEAPTKIPEDKALSEWSIPDGERAALDTLTLNGVEIEDFEPEKTTYTISIRDDQPVPVVAATYQGQSVEVKQAQSLYDSAKFSLLHDGETVDYKVNFLVEKVTYAFIQGYPITDADIYASSTTAEENGPAEIIDKNMETSCSSLGDGEFVIFDFGTARDFSKIELAWRWGKGRNYKFELLYSNDKSTWEEAYVGQSSGAGDDYELYEFGKTITARYLKLVGHGNNENLYNNMLEIR